jgi:hypothetical protein
MEVLSVLYNTVSVRTSVIPFYYNSSSGSAKVTVRVPLRQKVTVPTSVGDPWHFDVNLDPDLLLMDPDPDPTPDPTPFFINFKDTTTKKLFVFFFS